jgi:UDP-N-acetylglucosamine:LPS N-acetylglucosamine transferase
MKKIYVVASTGGHWIQLHRATLNIDYAQLIFSTPYPMPAELNSNQVHIQIQDFNRDNAYKAFKTCWQILKIMLKYKPDVVITTGAAPGLIALLLAKVLGKKGYWIDSIANSEKLSLSGKLSLKIATQTFTQWEHLATANIQYIGKVI